MCLSLILGCFSLFGLNLIVSHYYNTNIVEFIYNIIQNPTVGRYLILVFILINILLILRYIFLILLIYLISNKILTKSVFLPFFLIKKDLICDLI